MKDFAGHPFSRTGSKIRAEKFSIVATIENVLGQDRHSHKKAGPHGGPDEDREARALFPIELHVVFDDVWRPEEEVADIRIGARQQ